jgi:ERCC4-related helicase
MDIINNQNKLLGDDLKSEIKKDSKVKIVASCFSIYAFDALKEELKDLEELQFIFSSPTFIEEKVADKIKKEKREFYIPHEFRESSLYGTQFEVRLRNKLTQKAIAKECAEWIREKVKFKSNISGSAMPNFISVDSEDKQVAYLPVNSFTTGELGYENNHSLFQAITKMDDKTSTTMFMKQFDEVWEDNEKLEDVTDRIVEHIANAYNENSPEYIYFIILYNIFSEFLVDISEDYMPNELTGFKDSLIWNKLYNYQKDGMVGIVNKLEKYNGCILADSVGLGKTFTALAVMHYYDLKNKSILVLCPKKLANNWNSYKGNTKTNIFFKDRIRFDVLYHTDLGRKSGMSNGIDLVEIYWENYDLIVIDESHNFRNDFAFKGKETRYQFLMNKVIKKGLKTKVLMLSATPVNNKFKDLKNQLALAYGDDIEAFENKLDIEQPVKKIFLRAQRAFDAWIKLPQENRKAKDLIDNLDIDFSILLDSVTIARSRKHIVKYYDVRDIGSFPARLRPDSYYCDLTNRKDVIKYDEIYKQITFMNMGIYAPTNYILGSMAEFYSDMYDTKVEGRGALKQSSREKSLQRLMTTMMLKRLESSVEAFRITLKKLLNSNRETLEKIYEQQGGKKVFIEKKISEFSDVDEEDIELGGFSMGVGTTVGKIKIDLAHMNLKGWERDLKADVTILEFLLHEMEKIGINEDSKLNQLKKIIDAKMETPLNIGNKKVLIFSAFADTATYLYKDISTYMKSRYGLETAKVEGGTGENKATIPGVRDLDKVLTFFSPLSKEKQLLYPEENGVIDVLIGTDCISEGQNLQDCDICINYDIHWNPVRIVQRFGRIDRIGSRNKVIQLVNFWPNISLDEYIKLNDRVMGRMTIVNATGTADDNPISEDQLDADYRKVQLKKLQDGELQDLEDVDGSITITDLGLNEFRMDMVEYIRNNGEPKHAPKGMHAVVRCDEEKGIEKGIIYVLKNNINEINIVKQNRLHPYYIVYVKEDGEIKINHLGVKNTLDILRTTCKNQSEPIKDICKSFNKETKDGYKMDKCSKSLEYAIESIVDVKEESELSSLLNSGSKVLFQEKIKGLDDFELIAFVVIR